MIPEPEIEVRWGADRTDPHAVTPKLVFTVKPEGRVHEAVSKRVLEVTPIERFLGYNMSPDDTLWCLQVKVNGAIRALIDTNSINYDFKTHQWVLT